MDDSTARLAEQLKNNPAMLRSLMQSRDGQMLMQLRPDCIEDIIAAISLYRPGPMESIPKYIENRKNRDKITYRIPLLAPILDVTYGCMVYQEQVMQVCRTVAGYTFGRADLVRRMMAKKKADEMEKERAVFVAGAQKNGVDADAANELFDEMSGFASYAFNKSHAAAYALISYRTAYLKRHYPCEYLAALMTSVMGSANKTADYVAECSRYKIRILPPDINESTVDYRAIVNGKERYIRFGLLALKNIGEGFIDATKDFIKSITDVESDYYWYYQENTTPKMFVKLCLNKLLKLLTLNRFKPKKVLAYEPMRLSFADADRFYSQSKGYIYKLFEMAGYSDKSILFDQLLLPFNLFRFENYFDDDAFAFVIERDPRDVFISNKYYWSKQGEPVPYPVDVNEFCKYYKSLRQMEKPAQSDRICRIKFEDLIYNYDQTVSDIFKKLGWDESTHTARKTKFNPDRSIFNTQLFLKNEKYAQECSVIAEQLKEYLYDFPYEIEHTTKDVF